MFRSVSPGPGNIRNMILHSGVLITSPNPEIRSHNNNSDNISDNNHMRHSQGLESRVCRNLRYNLDKCRLAGDSDMYTR